MSQRAALLALGALVLGGACSDPPRKSRAQVIGALGDTIGGPHAIGTIGDVLLENDQIRLVIAKPGPGRVNTSYGGSLVDADLQRVGVDGAGPNGNDQLAELLPGFGFTVIEPTSVEVTADGSSTYAEVTVRGGGNDLLQMVYLLNTGLVFPETLQFSNAYRLYPGKKYVEIHTTVKNVGNGAHPFPYLNPTELKDLGFDIPGLENLSLSVPMGQLPLLGGEQTLFTPGRGGFNVRDAIEESYATAGFPAFPGMVTDFLASRGEGVSYGLTVPKADWNYTNAFAFPGQEVTPYSVLLPFTYAGVSAVYAANPPAQLQPQEEFTFVMYFIVGRGDVASVLDTIYELRNEPTGTFGGRVVDAQTSAPVALANVLVLDAADQPIDQLQTDARGAFLGHLKPGAYKYQVLVDDRLTSAPVAFTITAGQQTGALVEVAPPATLIVSVLDELSRRAPAKIQLIGSYPSPGTVGTIPCGTQQCKDPRDFLYSLTLGERRRPTAFDGTTRFVENAWWTKDGRIEARVRPGKYDLVVSRGPEYELTTVPVELVAGGFVTQQLTLTRAMPTDGWVAADFHIHAQPSTDSGLPIDQRVISCAAEGLEVAVATDHNYITDYTPVIAATGLDPWLVGISGMELTTFEMGHFNGFPLKVDAGSTRGGEFEWAGKTPDQIFDQLRTKLGYGADTIVQVNHPRQVVLGYFAQFFIDSLTALPYQPTGILGIFAPYGDEFKAENYSLKFDAVELITGNRLEDVHTFRAPTPLPPGPFPDPQPVAGEIVVGKDGRPQFPGVAETWFAMLDRGLTVTGTGTSDSHHLLGDEPGYARTLLFVGKGKDLPGAFSRQDVVAAVKAHRAIVTNAPFLEMSVKEGGVDRQIGDTVKVTGPGVDVRVRVRAPTWAKVDRIAVYSNSVLVFEQAIPANQQTDYETIVRLTLAGDAWVVAEATGSGNMFPVLSPTEFPPLDATVIIKALSAGLDLSTLPLTSDLKPNKIHFSTPFAMTNPIWIDTDGNGFTPPRPAVTKGVPGPTAPAPLPDIRQQFDALPELSP
ncbi:MAG: CehA/McbA family metallohydrolase [Deltaproteobacteria bacterium]|nr:CehA/McbA family metallohydrolase [Deltaproteobacteria bacterium]